MRKFLTLMIAVLTLSAGWAADETITFSSLYSSDTEVDGVTVSGTNVSLVFQKRSNGTATKYYTNGSAVRWYGGGTLTVSSTTKTIEQIEITYTQTANTVSTDVGSYSLSNKVGTWTGSASSVVFTQSGSSGHCRISSIAVTYAAASEPTDEFALAFTPVAGNYSAPVEVSIAPVNAVGEATITYTTDGSDPSASGAQDYTAPFTLYKTTTVKAYALDEDVNEATAEATYNITLPDVAATFDPSAGTYGAAQTVFVTLDNLYGVSGDDYLVTYKIDGQETTYDPAVGLSITESSTVTVEVTDMIREDEFTFSAAYVIDTDVAGPGDEVVFKYGKDEEFAQTNQTAMNNSSKKGVTVNFGAGSNTSNSPMWYSSSNGNARAYANNTITVDAGENKIESVTFTYDGSYAMSSPTVSPGSWSNSVWTVGATSGTLTVDNTTRISTITVKLAAAEGAVATPEISYAAGSYYTGDEVAVTITCATEGAAITYSTDNGETWTAYTEPLTVTETTTIQAKAELGGEQSGIASATINFGTGVATVAEFNALADDAAFKYTAANLTVLGQNGSYLYAQQNDGSKGILIYGAVGQTYSYGDVIPAGFTGVKTTFRGAPEMKTPAGFAAATETATPQAEELNITDINTQEGALNNFSRLVTLKDVTIGDGRLESDGATITRYDGRFNVEVPADSEGKLYLVKGVVGYFDAPQFMPLSFDEAVIPSEYTVSITPNGGTFTEPVTVTITTDGANGDEMVYYTLDGTDPSESDTAIGYEAPFVLSSSATVKVYASDEIEAEATAEAAFEINLPAITATFAPEAGTYTEAQTVYVTTANTFGDVLVTYSIDDAAEQDYDAEAGIAVEQSCTVTVFVADDYHSDIAEFTAEYVIAEAPATVTKTATIVFDDNGSDASSDITATELLAYITEGADYVSSVSNINKVYKGTTGIKFSSGKVNGSLTLNFADAFTGVKKVEVNAKQYSSDAASINDVSVGADLANYQILGTQTEPLTSLTLSATKRLYVKSITITYEEAAPEPMLLEGVSFGEGHNYATWYGDTDLALPEGMKAYVVTSVNGDEAVANKVDYIPASTGVLLFSEAEAENITAEPYDGTTTEVTSLLVGSSEEQTVEDGYLLYGDTFYRITAPGTLAAHRCYLPIPQAAGAPRLRIVEGGDTVTAVSDINATQSGAVKYVSITGQVSDRPFTGVNIVIAPNGTATKMIR